MESFQVMGEACNPFGLAVIYLTNCSKWSKASHMLHIEDFLVDCHAFRAAVIPELNAALRKIP